MSLNNPTFILYEKAYTGEGFHTTEVNGYIEAHKLLNDTNVFLGGSSYLYMKDAYHKEVLIWSAHLNDESDSHFASSSLIPEKENININVVDGLNKQEITFHYDSCFLANVSKNIFNGLSHYLQDNHIDFIGNNLSQKNMDDIEKMITTITTTSEDNFSSNNNAYKTTKF